MQSRPSRLEEYHMRKEDFTPDGIYDELFDYTFQHNCPDDEMNEIGGFSRVYRGHRRH